jgi:hypothetical protein
VSDLSPGTGWWLASDGKWYAPHLHPDAKRSASADPLPTFFEASVPGVGKPHGAIPPSTFFAGAPTGASPSGVGWSVQAGRSTSGRARWAIPVVGLIVLIGVITGGLVFVTSGKSSPSAIQSPAEANAALYAAALASGSFHYSVSSTATLEGKAVVASQIGNVGRNEGVQYMTSPIGDYEVIVINSMAYMKPNATMVENTFGYSPSEAASLAGRWISFTPSDAPYSSVAADVTTETTWNNPSDSPDNGLPTTPVSVSGVYTLNGQSVQSVRYSIRGTSKTASGSESGGETMVFSATDPHLPISATDQLSGTTGQQTASESDKVTFTQWGLPVSLTAPTGSIPYSTLPGTSTTD